MCVAEARATRTPADHNNDSRRGRDSFIRKSLIEKTQHLFEKQRYDRDDRTFGDYFVPFQEWCGLVHLIRAYFKHGLVNDKIVHAVLKVLLIGIAHPACYPEYEAIEVSTDMLMQAGKRLDVGEGKEFVDCHMRCFTALKGDIRIPFRLREKLNRLLALREAKWDEDAIVLAPIDTGNGADAGDNAAARVGANNNTRCRLP